MSYLLNREDQIHLAEAIKKSVRIASSTNVNLTSMMTTLDGLPLLDEDRVLLKTQSFGAENGIYIWSFSTKLLSRALNADLLITSGMLVAVEEGTSADKVFILTTNNPITIGITPLNFAELVSGTGFGESNTGTNTGSGSKVYKQKSGVTFEFRTLTGGSNVTVTENSNDIEISANVAGESNTASNVGGGEQIFKQKSGVDLQFRTLIPGSNITLTQNSNDIEIGTDFIAGLGGFWVETYEVWVAPNDPTAKDDFVLNTPFLTIQGAINALEVHPIPAGGVWGSPAGSFIRPQIKVATGIYNENLEIPTDAYLILTAMGPVVLGSGDLDYWESSVSRDITWINDSVVEASGSHSVSGSQRRPTLILNSDIADAASSVVGNETASGWYISGNLNVQGNSVGNPSSDVELYLSDVRIGGALRSCSGGPCELMGKCYTQSYRSLIHLGIQDGIFSLSLVENSVIENVSEIYSYGRVVNSYFDSLTVAVSPSVPEGFINSNVTTFNSITGANLLLDTQSNSLFESGTGSLSGNASKKITDGYLEGSVALVNPSAFNALDNDSLETPFITIQGAINALNTLVLGAGESKTILVSPGLYEEQIFIGEGIFTLKGLGGFGIGRISPQIESSVVIRAPGSNMPAITITDATQASAGPWTSNPGTYLSNYGSLVWSGLDAPSVEILDIELIGNGSSSYGLVLAGVNGTPVCKLDRSFVHNGLPEARIWGYSTLFRMSNCPERTTSVTGASYFYNSSTIFQFISYGRFIIQDTTSEFENSTLASIDISGSSNVTFYYCQTFSSGATVSNTSSFSCYNSILGGNCTFGGSAEISLYETMITGNCTASSGVGGFDMEGGYIRGTLNDSSNRLIFNNGQPLNKKVAIVNPSHNMSNDNILSLGNPFRTIQAAVKAVENLSPTEYEQGLVQITPGRYDETVIINTPYITLEGLGSGIGQDVIIQNLSNTDYPAVVVSSGTSSSIQSWLAGGSSNWLSNYGTLVDGGTPVGKIRLVNLTAQGGALGVSGLVVAKVGTSDVSTLVERSRIFDVASVWGVWSYGGTCQFHDSSIGTIQEFDLCLSGAWRSEFREVHLYDSSSMIMRFCSTEKIELFDTSVFGYTIPSASTSHNVHIFGSVYLHDGAIFDIDGGFITSSVICDGTSTWQGRNCHIKFNISCGDTSGCTADNVYVEGDVTIDGGSAFHNHGYVGGDVTVNGATGRWTGNDIHVGGNFNLNNAACIAWLYGGRYMGIVAGPGTFNRTLGS